MILILEIGMLLVGATALITGRIWLTRARTVEGMPARMTGLVLVVPLLLHYIPSFILGAVSAWQAKEVILPDWTKVLEVVNPVLGLLIGVCIAVGFARPPKELLPQEIWREKLGERIAAAVLFVGAVAVTSYWSVLPLTYLVALWVVIIVTLIVLMRLGWLKLFGPILFYDLIRVGRRGRYVLLRFLYAMGLLVVIGSTYFLWWLNRRTSGEALTTKDLANLGELFFYVFMIVQYLLVIVLTPGYVAGTIAEEKDRKTMEYLLATDLRNREIIFGKLAARLANMLLLVLAGLPILSLIQFFGGIEPDQVLAGFASLGLTVISLASLSIFWSVQARKPFDAFVLSYLTVAAYTILSLAVQGTTYGFGFGSWSPVAGVTIQDLADGFSSGNLIWALGELKWGKTPQHEVLWPLLAKYAIFHGVLTLVLLSWAVARVRVSLKESYGRTSRLPLLSRIFGRPGIGNQPMLWKEIIAESRLGLGWLGKLIVAILVLASFAVAALVVVYTIVQYGGYSGRGFYGGDLYKELGMYTNFLVARLTGTGIACLTLLAVAVRAASSITGERAKQTFDGLLTTPLSSNSILIAKWLGSILSVRWAWLWLGSIWGLSVLLGGLHPLAVPLLIGAWLVYAAAFAWVGIWFSMVSRSTLRAIMWTLLTLLVLGGGHWVLTTCCLFAVSLMWRGGHEMEYLLYFLAGQTPPFVLGFFALSGYEFERNHSDLYYLIGFSLFGLGCWMVGSFLLAGLASSRFQDMTGRRPFQRPELRGNYPAWTNAAPPPAGPPSEPLESIPLALPAEPDPHSQTSGPS